MDSVELERSLSETAQLKQRIAKLESILEQIIVECDKWALAPLEGILRLAKEGLK